MEFIYKQAPLLIKNFIMSLFLLSTSVGNLFTAVVNSVMVEPLQASAIETGAQTWVSLADAGKMVVGQKIDFAGDNGVTVTIDDKTQPLAGTFMVAEVDAAASRVRLMDAIHRQPMASDEIGRASCRERGGPEG